MIQDLFSRFQDWSGIGRPGRRKWIFLSTAVVLAIIGQVLKNVPLLRSLESVAWGVVSDLGNINVLSFLGTYFQHLSGEFINPIQWIVSVPTAAFDTMSRSPSSVALLVYLMAFATGLVLSNYLYRQRVRPWFVRLTSVPGTTVGADETNLLDLVFISIGAVFLMTVAALGLQIFAIVVFAIFGGALGLAIYFATGGKWIIDLYKAGRKVYSVAQARDAGAMKDAVADIVLGERTDPLAQAKGIQDTASSLEKATDWVTGKFKPPS
jgi:hypothetical protein